jgi:hypothetical protein
MLSRAWMALTGLTTSVFTYPFCRSLFTPLSNAKLTKQLAKAGILKEQPTQESTFVTFKRMWYREGDIFFLQNLTVRFPWIVVWLFVGLGEAVSNGRFEQLPETCVSSSAVSKLCC